jgi:hypothetical protein
VKQLYLGNRSEKDTCTYTLFCLEWPILWPPRILIFPPGTSCIYTRSASSQWHWFLSSKRKPQFEWHKCLGKNKTWPWVPTRAKAKDYAGEDQQQFNAPLSTSSTDVPVVMTPRPVPTRNQPTMKLVLEAFPAAWCWPLTWLYCRGCESVQLYVLKAWKKIINIAQTLYIVVHSFNE